MMIINEELYCSFKVLKPYSELESVLTKFPKVNSISDLSSIGNNINGYSNNNLVKVDSEIKSNTLNIKNEGIVYNNTNNKYNQSNSNNTFSSDEDEEEGKKLN